MCPINSKIRDTAVYRLAFVYMTAVCLHALASAAFAATGVEDEYIDSVYSWGIWELELEPASGPLVSANNAINDRSRRLQFRPNDNAAYMTLSVPVPLITIVNPPPPVPVAPTISVGPPGFTSGSPTTMDPRNQIKP